ncbi:MAG: spore protease YyaC [Clostridium sp.]|nr:spore protease YyaC [Clostridium sp.]MCM1399620.1 spore protease YyaC [Clostridium sp.]MCM1460480.1 spore protease YyaC [Bacteroides sp.]
MNDIVSKKSTIEYFDTMNSYSYEELGKFIFSLLPKEDLINYTPIILCIGTDRATGDCLGPLVGEQLINYDSRFTVMGCLQTPVHALNIRETICSIRTGVENPFIIAVDASLGLTSHVGYITVSNEPILPGKGVNKRLPAIGDVSITGIVNVSGQSPGLLQSTRLYTVVQLANCIADALKYAIDYLDDFWPL